MERARDGKGMEGGVRRERKKTGMEAEWNWGEFASLVLERIDAPGFC